MDGGWFCNVDVEACRACEKAATAERFGEAEGLAKEAVRDALEKEFGYGELFGGDSEMVEWDRELGDVAGTLGMGRLGGGPAGLALAADERRRWEISDDC